MAFLATMQMVGARGVNNDTVRQIGRHNGREVLQHPKRQPIDRVSVGGRIGVLNDEPRHEDLRLGGGHADAKAGGLRRSVRRQHQPPPSFPADQDEGRLRRRREDRRTRRAA
jgi:hypothetical protein